MADAGSFAGFKRRALERAVPLSVHLELTYGCNWRCVFCYNPRHHDLRRLDLAEWCAVLDDLRELGTLTVTLTGGEPLTHPDFFALAEAVRARAFALKLFSNGSLIDEALADRLAALRPMAVEMSLHGAGAEVHDATTGRPGSFDALWAAVELLERRRVPILLKTPLTRLNEHQLETMVAQVKGRGLSHSVDPTLTPNDTGDPAPLAYAASPAGVERLMRVLLAHDRLPLARRTEGGSNCGLGRMTLAVDPEGNVYPCLQWRQTSLGNVRGTRLRELWRAAPERQEAADVARAANDALLRRGGAAATFPYCPALAFQRSGDPLTPDPAFLANSAIAERVRQAAGRAGGRASQ